MSRNIIPWASREKRRAVNAAVGGNFLKTITEPVTNSDSALKKQAAVPHGAGLVPQILKLKVNDRLNTPELRQRIPKGQVRKIRVQLFTSGPNARLCKVIDAGPGMSLAELEANFGTYASAKAKGEKTRSLFGRGALDVLLYHEESVIYSVKDRVLSRAKLFWEKDAICDVEELGPATRKLLDSFDLPHEISNSGTVVQFRLKEGTPIPQEDQIVAKVSGFYMLRLISADPNTEVVIERHRAQGSHHLNLLSYDFPIGTVVGCFQDVLDLGEEGKLPVDILVARSDVPLENDPIRRDRRENGLLFVDENDAVLDLTLLPEYDKSPYLKHIYGIVRVSNIRSLLESKLEAENAEAVLTTTREGFAVNHEITQKLFRLVESHVKALYDKEEQREKKGDSTRSDKMNQRVKEVLKVLNQFNADETEEPPPPPPPKPDKAIYFHVESTRLYASAPMRLYLYVNLGKVNVGEIVLFETDNPEIKIEPDSETVKGSKGGIQRIALTATCDVKNQRGTITALTLGKDGEELQATVKILGVDDPPVFTPPEYMEFASPRFAGDPNRANKAVLLVNLDAFQGMPEITFWLEEKVGNVSLGDGLERLNIKVKPEHVIEGHRLARLPVSFQATGWGQHAVLRAKAKRRDGEYVHAKCRLRFEHQQGDQKFSNFHYEDLDRQVLGDFAQDKLYVNAGYSLHREIFGDTEPDFYKRLEDDPIAQLRAAAVLVESAVYSVATRKHKQGRCQGITDRPGRPNRKPATLY